MTPLKDKINQLLTPTFGETEQNTQRIADLKFDGDCSQAIDRVMAAVAENVEQYPAFTNEFDCPLNDENLSAKLRDIAEFIDSDLVKIIGVPSGLVDLALIGSEALSLSVLIDRQLNSKSTAEGLFYSCAIYEQPKLTPHNRVKLMAEMASAFIVRPSISKGGEK